jgi:hypothetical protein
MVRKIRLLQHPEDLKWEENEVRIFFRAANVKNVDKMTLEAAVRGGTLGFCVDLITKQINDKDRVADAARDLWNINESLQSCLSQYFLDNREKEE